MTDPRLPRNKSLAAPSAIQLHQSEAEGRLASLLARAGVFGIPVGPKRKFSTMSTDAFPTQEQATPLESPAHLSELVKEITSLIDHSTKIGAKLAAVNTAEKHHEDEVRLYREFEEANFYQSATCKETADMTMAKAKEKLQQQQTELGDLGASIENRAVALIKGIESHIRHLVSQSVSETTQELASEHASERSAIENVQATAQSAVLARIADLESRSSNLENEVAKAKLNMSLSEIGLEKSSFEIVAANADARQPRLANSSLSTEIGDIKAKLVELEEKLAAVHGVVGSIQANEPNIFLVKEDLTNLQYEFKSTRNQLQEFMRNAAAVETNAKAEKEFWEERLKKISETSNDRFASVENRINLLNDAHDHLREVKTRVSKLEGYPTGFEHESRISSPFSTRASRPPSRSSVQENTIPKGDSESQFSAPSEAKQKRDKEVFTSYGMFTPPRKRADRP